MDKIDLKVPFQTIVRMPNGLQWHKDELFVMDQFTDDVFVFNHKGKISRVINTKTENGSGITIGGGYLWTASNGQTRARPFRDHDDHFPKVIKIDLNTGESLDAIPVPEGSGIHGIEWDEGNLWITATSLKTLILIDGSNHDILHQIPCKLDVLHGLAKDGEGIWCSDRGAKKVVKFHKNSGVVMEEIVLPPNGPDPHGLSILNGVLWYSDADFPPPSSRGYPEIGFIQKRCE